MSASSSTASYSWKGLVGDLNIQMDQSVHSMEGVSNHFTLACMVSLQARTNVTLRDHQAGAGELSSARQAVWMYLVLLSCLLSWLYIHAYPRGCTQEQHVSSIALSPSLPTRSPSHQASHPM